MELEAAADDPQFSRRLRDDREVDAVLSTRARETDEDDEMFVCDGATEEEEKATFEGTATTSGDLAGGNGVDGRIKIKILTPPQQLDADALDDVTEILNDVTLVTMSIDDANQAEAGQPDAVAAAMIVDDKRRPDVVATKLVVPREVAEAKMPARSRVFGLRRVEADEQRDTENKSDPGATRSHTHQRTARQDMPRLTRAPRLVKTQTPVVWTPPCCFWSQREF